MKLIRIFIAIFMLIPAWICAFVSRKYNKEKIHNNLSIWSRRVISVLGYKLIVEGVENLETKTNIYFVSNHQGTFDPAIILGASNVPISFISKKQNEKLPLIGSWSKTIKNIHFDRDSREDNIRMLRESARRLKAKDNLLIFPEGTRSKNDIENEFKVGSIQPAYLGKSTIIPIVLNNSYAFDQRKPKSNKIKIKFLKPIVYEDYKKYSQKEISQILHDLIEKEITFS